MRDQRVYAAGAAAVKVSQSQTAAAHLISSGKANNSVNMRMYYIMSVGFKVISRLFLLCNTNFCGIISTCNYIFLLTKHLILLAPTTIP